MTNPLKFFVTLMLFSIPILHVRSESYVREACSVTLYQDVCIRSLASYSHNLKRSPRRWARVGVSVTIREVKSVSQHLNVLRKRSYIRGKRTRAALSDCVECIQDTLDNLHRALQVLRRLSFRAFDEQMNDVLTWLSAALTDEDTCIDGFEGMRKARRVARFCDKVQNASYITSNALALANKLATTGLHDLSEDHHDDQHHP